MYYFIGIKGTGMSALALIMHDLGHKVLGSDKPNHFFTQDPLVERGIELLAFNEDNIKKGMIIVKGNAFDENHEEVKRARELGLVVYTYPEMVGKITEKFKLVGISGCHGKTITTSMMAHILNNTKGSNYLIGDGTGYARPDNEYFALEACEYKRHFLEYNPHYAIITNIELDHVDYFDGIDDVVLAYQQYANRASKMVIACGDDPYTRSLDVSKPIFFYGLSEDNDIIAKNVEYSNDGISFEVFVEGNYYGFFDLPLFGKHMLLNSLAVISVCYYERIDAKQVAKHFKTYEGAKRRFKEKVIGDIVTIDDYAHHPTEVRVTLKGARQKYPDKEIVAVMLINTYSRAAKFENEFVNALNLADKAYVMDIYVDREEDFEPFDAKKIIDKLDNGEYINNDMAHKLLKHKNAVIVFMSCKEIYVLQKAYEQQLIKTLDCEK